MRIAFEALIKKYQPISLLSGDKQIKIELQLNDNAVNNETLSGLSDLWLDSPEPVICVLMDKGSAENVRKS